MRSSRRHRPRWLPRARRAGRSQWPSLPAGLATVRLRRTGRPLTGTYAVVDVETTGLVPGRDRVVELAVVTTDERGRVVDEWSTLVDPGCDLDASDVHGIDIDLLAGSAPFVEVAPELARRLHDRVVVAHNLAFDAAFLTAEHQPILGRATAGLCTLQLSRAVLDRPTDGWSLGALCDAVGVPLDDPHRALGDARATAGLLGALLAEIPGSPRPLARRLVASRVT